MLGMHGNIGPNVNTNRSDVIIAIGMRFDERATGKPENFGINAKIIHMEIDPAEVNKLIYADVAVMGDVKKTLPLLTEQIVKKEQAREWIYLSPAMVKCVKIWLFSEYEVHRQNQARKAREVVPFEGVALDEKHGKQSEYDQ